MISRSSNPIPNNSNSIHRICTSMRTNIILRNNCNHKPTISNPIRRKGNSSMSMGWICCRQRNINTILRIPLPNTIRNRSSNHSPPTIPTPNRIQQPTRTKQKHRQNPIPPILH
ncbi:hypothetical protein Cfor_05466, partial [Coptotermes formosanus]